MDCCPVSMATDTVPVGWAACAISIPGDSQTNVHRKVIKLHFGMD